MNFAEFYDALRRRGLGFADIERMTFDQVNFEFTRNEPEPRDIAAESAKRQSVAFRMLDELCQKNHISVIALKAQKLPNTVTQLTAMGQRVDASIVDEMVRQYVTWKMGET